MQNNLDVMFTNSTKFYNCECYNNSLIKNMNKENNTYH